MRVGRGRRGLLDIIGYRVRVIGCSLAGWPDMDGSWPGPRSGTSSSYDEGVDDTWPAGTGGPSAADVNGAVDARLEALLGAASGPVNWRSVASSAARQRWLELRDWVDWLRVEFGFDHRVVPPCWYRHRAMVSMLSALRDHWVCAYDPVNTPIGASDWHRGLMQLEQRLREWASRTGCTASGHRPDVLAEYADDAETWEAHIADDVSARAEREMRAAAGAVQRAFAIGRETEDDGDA
jgi:hypothetical protein